MVDQGLPPLVVRLVLLHLSWGHTLSDTSVRHLHTTH